VSSHASIRRLPWAVVDLELTGLHPTRDAICELAILRVEDGVEVERFQSRVRPGVPVSKEALSIHGLTDELLAQAPGFGDVLAPVMRLLDGAVLIAHNAPVDVHYLSKALAAVHGEPPWRGVLDTLPLSRGLLALPSHRLNSLAKLLGFPHEGAHSALGDAEATWKLTDMLLTWLDPDDGLSLGQVQEAIQAREKGSPAQQALQAMLLECAKANQTVVFDYLTRRDGEGFSRTRREVAVWNVKWPRVEGFCFLRQEKRVFRVERMVGLVRGSRTLSPSDVG